MADGDWFEVRRFPNGVTLIREPHHSEDVKVYLIEGSRDVAVLDTGLGVGDFSALVASLSAKRPRVLQTHAHWDHIGASHRFEDVLVHPAEAEGLRRGWPAERYVAAFSPELVDISRIPADFDPSGGLPGREPTGRLEEGDRVDLGDRVLEVIHTPGHSPAASHSSTGRRGRSSSAISSTTAGCTSFSRTVILPHSGNRSRVSPRLEIRSTPSTRRMGRRR